MSLAAAPRAAQAQPLVRLGSDLQINAYTSGSQAVPAVAMAANGVFVVVWHSPAQDGSLSGIFARRFDATGLALATELQVNTRTAGNQTFPTVAMAPAGAFVVAWQGALQDDDTYSGIFAQRFDSEGAPQGVEFQVNSYSTGQQYAPAIAMEPDGDFVVAWDSYLQDGYHGGIFAQRFDSAGVARGIELQVNLHTEDRETNPAVAVDGDGDFVVAWQGDGQEGADYGIVARRFNSAGVAQGGELLVNAFATNQQTTPSVDLSASGDFVVAWRSIGQDGAPASAGVFARRFSAAGTPQAAELQVNTRTADSQAAPRVAMDSDGEFVVAWESNLQDGSLTGTFARRFNAQGVAQATELQVNTYTTSSQNAPAIALDDDGQVAVAWQSNGQDGNSIGVFAGRLAMAPITGEIPVNSYIVGQQNDASIGLDADGDFVVVWGSENQDGSAAGIFGQRFDSAGVRRGTEFLVNASTSGSQILGGVGVEDDGDFVVTWESDSPGIGKILVRRFDSSGTPGAEFQIDLSTTTPKAPSLGIDSDGDFVVAWTRSDGFLTGVRARRFNSLAAPQGFEFQVNLSTAYYQDQAAVGMDADGDFVVAWRTGLNYYGISARRFNASGAALGFELAVTDSGTSDSPSIGVDANGDFVVAWSNSAGDGSHFDILARRFSSSGASLGGEFRVNVYTPGQQSMPSVALSASGDFVVTWHSFISEDTTQDGWSSGVFARRFSSAGVPDGVEFQVNVRTVNSQFRPAVARDDAGDFVVAWESSEQDGSLNGVFARRFPIVPTSTPSLTPSVTPTQTQTPSRTPTLMATSTPTYTRTSTATATQTPTRTPTRTATSTPSSTPTPTLTPTATGTSTGGPELDVDGNGTVEPLTDGLLFLRYAFSFTGAPLTAGVVDLAHCTRCDGAAVTAYLNGLGLVLDIDGDLAVEPLTDGLLVLRFLFGFGGTTLTNGTVDLANCTRCNAAAIEPYLQSLKQ